MIMLVCAVAMDVLHRLLRNETNTAFRSAAVGILAHAFELQ